MKLEIFDKPVDVEPIVRLRFVKNDMGDLRVEAVGPDGRVLARVLRIKANGKLWRYPYLNNTELGFVTDANGRIALDE